MVTNQLWARLRPWIASAISLGVLTSCAVVVRRTWPDRDERGEVEGISAPLTIYLDKAGVPHIFAATDGDGAQAVGWLHGRYRRFQMEMIRLASQGRLSEALGRDMLPTDKRLRLLTYQLDESVANLPPEDRARAEAYCRGVNQAWKDSEKPLEFKLLGFEPKPWTVRDVVAVGRLQSWDLSNDAENEAIRDRLRPVLDDASFAFLTSPSAHLGTPILGQEEVRDQRPALPPVPAPPGPTTLVDASGREVEAVPSKEERSSPSPMGELDPGDRDDLVAGVTRWIEHGLGGSNGWAIAPQKTSHGKAILAGDPHLDLPWPPIFYEVHLHTPEVDVSGATFPGLPMVVIGRAANVAWTLTTSYADTQDLFVITPDPTNPDQYLVDNQGEKFINWPQTFTWGTEPGESETVNFQATRFGPVYNNGREERLKANTLYALRWPGFDPDPLALTSAFDTLYRAKSPEDVFKAVELLPIPSQNWTFATDSGHIGYILGGKLPARPDSPLPRDGSRSDSAWQGWVSSEQRPRLVDPPSGFIVASNQAISPALKYNRGYASGTYRALRITTALEARTDWDTASVRGLQVDVVNLEAARVVPVLLDALEKAPLPTDLGPDTRARVDAMVASLRGWKFEMDKAENAPLVYESWRAHVHHVLAGFYLTDPALRDAYLKARFSEAAMETALFTEEGRKWWGSPGAAPDPLAREKSITAALLLAEAELSGRFGSDIESWTWGEAHSLTTEHPFQAKAVLRPIFGHKEVPASGGRHTIFALNHFGILGDYKVDSGPALRQVVEPGTSAGFVLPGGNAGQPDHPWSYNQMDDWWAGRQHRAGGDEKTLSEQAAGIIEWSPARK